MERSGPLVSVLIPAFNHERYIESCLDSVASSDHALLELLIIDDGSTDGTFAVAQSWLRRNEQRFVRSEVRTRPNAGICATLNELVTWSTGEYICLLASDDELLESGVSARVEHLERHPQHAAVVSDVELIDNDGELLDASALHAFGYRSRVLPKDRLLWLFLCSWTPPFSHQFFRGKWLREHPYPAELGFEDYYTALLLSSRRQITLLPVATMRYRVPHLRTHGGLPRATLLASNVASMDAALGRSHRDPVVEVAMRRARRTARLDGGSDVRTKLCTLFLLPIAFRYRRLLAVRRRVPPRPTAVRAPSAQPAVQNV